MTTLTFPKIDTLQARALMRLLTGHQFTHADFQNETASYRLSSYIERLRNKHNWPIETKLKTALTTDIVSRNASHAIYLIDYKILIVLRFMQGERLAKFIEAVKNFESGGTDAK